MPTSAIKKSSVKSGLHTERYIVVGKTAKRLPDGVLACRHLADLPAAVREAQKRNRLFVSYGRSATDELLHEGLKLGRGVRMGDLLALELPRKESIPALSGIFGRVVGATEGYRWLPFEELTVVLTGKNAADRFIGGAADPKGKTLALVRGDLATLVVSFDHFKPSGDGTKPDFTKLSFTDYGLTVALGEYQASADGILYEVDSAYRQKLNKERRATDRGFGPSLRRLRVQRQLKRTDFPGISSKTIARIERGEVEQPHGKTLAVIAKRLGVDPGEVESY